MFAGFSTGTQGQNIDMFNRSIHAQCCGRTCQPQALVDRKRIYRIHTTCSPRTTEAATSTQCYPSDYLWLECVANNTNEDDSEFGPGQLPRELGKEIEAFRAMRL